jgi:hypothetical protein
MVVTWTPSCLVPQEKNTDTEITEMTNIMNNMNRTDFIFTPPVFCAMILFDFYNNPIDRNLCF